MFVTVFCVQVTQYYVTQIKLQIHNIFIYLIMKITEKIRNVMLRNVEQYMCRNIV